MRVCELLYKQKLIHLNEACPEVFLSLMNEIRLQMEQLMAGILCILGFSSVEGTTGLSKSHG